MANCKRIMELFMKAVLCEIAAEKPGVCEQMRLMWQYNAEQLRMAARELQAETP